MVILYNSTWYSLIAAHSIHLNVVSFHTFSIHKFRISFKSLPLLVALRSYFGCSQAPIFFCLLYVQVYVCIQFSFVIFFISQANRVKWSLTSTKVALFFRIILWAIVDVRMHTPSGPVFTHQKTLQMFIAAAAAAVTAAMHSKSANNTLETVLFQDYRYHFNEYIFTLAICVYKTATQNCY